MRHMVSLTLHVPASPDLHGEQILVNPDLIAYAVPRYEDEKHLSELVFSSDVSIWVQNPYPELQVILRTAEPITSLDPHHGWEPIGEMTCVICQGDSEIQLDGSIACGTCNDEGAVLAYRRIR